MYMPSLGDSLILLQTSDSKLKILEIKTSNCDFIKIFRILEPLDWGLFFPISKDPLGLRFFFPTNLE